MGYQFVHKLKIDSNQINQVYYDVINVDDRYEATVFMQTEVPPQFYLKQITQFAYKND